MFWDTLRSDLQHTLRLAWKTPMITLLTILALALGIGATSAIYAVVDAVLMKPLPYTDSERLVSVWSDATRQGRPRNTISPANFRDFQQMNQTLQGLEGYFSFVTPFEIAVDGPSEIAIGVTVTPGLFDLLGRAPDLGRGFRRDQYAFEIILSHGYGNVGLAAIRPSWGARCRSRTIRRRSSVSCRGTSHFPTAPCSARRDSLA